MTFAYTILYVPDVARSIAFYERAFGFARRFIAPGGEYGELDTGATTLSFAAHTMAQSNLSKPFTTSSASEPPFGIEIGIATPDVAAAVDKALAAGATLAEAPKTKPWGQTVAYVRDPDGFLVELCTPMS
ncbi:MAG: VOC family protein [Chitinophagaceae bacterium]|nr:MAG: VOC family protein [Chitinophagaceae bacterium]